MPRRPAAQCSTRKHPLTVEGDEIGTFDLTFACGEPGKDLTVTYFEQRRGDAGRAPAALTDVGDLACRANRCRSRSCRRGAGRPAPSSSFDRERPRAGRPVQNFADPRSRSLTVETTSDDTLDRDPDRQCRRRAQLPATGGELRGAAGCEPDARTQQRKRAAAAPRSG